MILENNDSILEAILNDLGYTFGKYKYVLRKSCFLQNCQELKEWDLIGPFIITIFYPLFIYLPTCIEDNYEQNRAYVYFFLFLWVGSLIAGLNACLLDSFVHYYTVTSIVLYGLLPSCLTTLVTRFMPDICKPLLIIPSSIYGGLLCYKFIKANTTRDKLHMVYTPIFFMYCIVTIVSMVN